MKTSFHQLHISMLSVSAILCVLASHGLSEQIELVSPSQFTDTESHDDVPSISGGGAIGARAQYLYEASDFSSLDGPHWITQFAWRPDGRQSNRTVSATSNRVLFRMSTTNRTVRNMSMTYAANIGSDEQVVAHIDEPQTTTVSVLGPEGGPKEFTLGGDIIPFLYDPSQGNLLLDMELFGGSTLPADSIATPSTSLTTKWIAGPLAAPRAFAQMGGIVTQFTFVPFIEGDYDKSGELDIADVMLLAGQIQSDTPNLDFDLDDDSQVTPTDLNVWVRDLRNTWIGDSNLDGLFDSGDFVDIFEAGQYEDDIVGNSTWITGDWNGDREFDSGDLIFAFQDGGFEAGQRPIMNAVPEPGSLVLAVLAFLGFCQISRNRR